MKPFGRYVVALLAVLAFSAAVAADGGIYTVVEGDARVMRGTTWYKLAPGARAQEGDVLELGERGSVLVELARGGALLLGGPASAFAAALPAVDAKAGATEWAIVRGWTKIAAPPSPGLRLRTAAASVDLADTIVVAAVEPTALRMFVESGTGRVALPAARGKEAPSREAKAGDFVTRTGERALVVETRAAPAFVTAMPPSMRDALPRLAARYKVAPPAPPPGAEVSYAEAEPWLGGPYRRTFVRRLTPRLSDPAFRGSVEPHLAAYPEWDRVLHPEKYPVEAAVPRKP